jgi:hypothetical protein
LTIKSLQVIVDSRVTNQTTKEFVMRNKVLEIKVPAADPMVLPKGTDSRIGVLCRKGKPIYYAYAFGGQYYERYTIEDIEMVLELSDTEDAR